MKKIIILGCFLTATLVTKANTDSAQLKEQVQQMEKLVKQLQSEIKTLKTTDSTLTAELNTLRQSIPANNRQKKLVIDRRGSKQASFQ